MVVGNSSDGSFKRPRFFVWWAGLHESAGTTTRSAQVFRGGDMGDSVNFRMLISWLGPQNVPMVGTTQNNRILESVSRNSKSLDLLGWFRTLGNIMQHPCFECRNLAKLVGGILTFCMGFPKLYRNWWWKLARATENPWRSTIGTYRPFAAFGNNVLLHDFRIPSINADVQWFWLTTLEQNSASSRSNRCRKITNGWPKFVNGSERPRGARILGWPMVRSLALKLGDWARRSVLRKPIGHPSPTAHLL